MSTWSKVWGRNTEIFRNSSCSVNIIHCKTGTRCSWHVHNTKYNLFHVIEGLITIRTEHGNHDLTKGMSYLVHPGVRHEFRVMEESIAIEVMFVEYDPADIERFNVGGLL